MAKALTSSAIQGYGQRVNEQDTRDIGADIRHGVGYLVIAAVAAAVMFVTKLPDGDLHASGFDGRDLVNSLAGLVALFAVVAGLTYLLRGLFARR